MFRNLYDGPIGQTLSRLGDLILLQVAFLITSLPIFTVGAGISALYSVCRRLHRDDVSYVLKAYWEAFRENFKTGTVLWLSMLAVLTVLGGSAVMCIRNNWRAIQILSYVLLILSYFAWHYAYAFAAWFENRPAGHLQNSLKLSLAKPLELVMFAAMDVCFLLLLEYARPLIFILGASGTIYLKTAVLQKRVLEQNHD